MNYLPVAGYFFYGAASDATRPRHFASWGLMDDLPTATYAEPITIFGRRMNIFALWWRAAFGRF